MLYLIGLGLNDEYDISLKGYEAIKQCDKIYLESYTSKLSIPIENLEKLHKKKILPAPRELVESNKLIEEAKTSNIALLIIGDVFSATTHISLVLEAEKAKVGIGIINNASILTAVGITGLELYKFGATTSIPFNYTNITTPIEIIKKNQSLDLHTLILLDLDPINNKYLSVTEACNYLVSHNIDDNIIACQKLGSKNFKIKYAHISKIKFFKLNEFPQCLIIPAKKLHFVEADALEKWK